MICLASITAVSTDFFAVEIDRNTESIERKRIDQSAFSRKFAGYAQILSDATFRRVWGIPNLLVIIVTTNATHMSNLIDYARQIGTDADKFLFQSKPEFGLNWKIPPVMDEILLGDWARTSTPFSIHKA